MAIPVELLVGPVAALALALWIINTLWKAHQAADKREQDRADALERRVVDLTAILKKAAPK